MSANRLPHRSQGKLRTPTVLKKYCIIYLKKLPVVQYPHLLVGNADLHVNAAYRQPRKKSRKQNRRKGQIMRQCQITKIDLNAGGQVKQWL